MTRVAIVTGSGRRLGRAIARRLFNDGFKLFLHCNRSVKEVEALCEEMNRIRSGSAVYYSADFNWEGAPTPSGVPSLSVHPCCAMRTDRSEVNKSSGGRGDSEGVGNRTPLSVRCEQLVQACVRTFGRCDVLINNASAFFPTPLVAAKERVMREDDGCPQCYGTLEGQEQEPPCSPTTPEGRGEVEARSDSGMVTEQEAAACLLGSNALAPYFLTKAFANVVERSPDSRTHSSGETSEPMPEKPSLALPSRAIVNVIDSMIDRPIPGFTLYTMGKHALLGLTTSAAIELAPRGIRVNAVSPGLSLLPDGMSASAQQALRETVPLGQKEASAEVIADAVAYLVSSPYITGISLPVDGGWRLSRYTDPQQVKDKW